MVYSSQFGHRLNTTQLLQLYKLRDQLVPCGCRALSSKKIGPGSKMKMVKLNSHQVFKKVDFYNVSSSNPFEYGTEHAIK